MIRLSGEYTDAQVMGVGEEAVEEMTLEQIQTMIDNEAFRNPVRVMPDCHPGAGSVVGFTMPLGTRVIPNVVGVDKGCGMESRCLGPELPVEGEELDKRVRDRVPMGFGQDGLKAPNRDYYHVKNDFPWDEANETLAQFIKQMDEAYVEPMEEFYEDGGYDIEYFKELCGRAATQSGYFDVQTAISSVGTLGSGNHFIEIGQSVETGDYWVTIHSGSRGLGNNAAQYWQDYASKLRRSEEAREALREVGEDYVENFVKFDLDEVTDKELLEWLQGSKGESFVDYEALNEHFGEDEPHLIEQVGNQLKDAIPTGPSDADELAYLEGEEAAGYLIDLIFCQHYAVENRRVMAEAVADALGVEPTDRIVATHNYIDFRDGIIRKGATRAYEGERAVVPFNMKDGTLIIEGKSNEEWNYSSPHGAGRVMSRRQAHEEFSEDDLREQMEEAGAYATAFPVDESPDAYKSADVIEDAIKETATIVDRLEVVHNWKADD